jgi:glycosyltransferase involved in cell wall biosynthesis
MRAAVTQTQPVVDVAIPTNRPRYLGEAIESVLAQTFESWRLTISDNSRGSDDITAVVEPYLSDPRVHLVATRAELSAPENATRAVQAGDAQFVGLLHDDDRWDADFLARRVAFLESNPSCGFVFSHCKFIDEAGRVVFRLTIPLDTGVQPRRAFLRALYRRNLIAMPSLLVRRAAYEAVGESFSESVLFNDYEMWFRIAARFDVGFLNVWDNNYRIHNAQATHPEQAHLGEHRLELLGELDQWLPDDFPTLERRRARSGAYFRAAYDAFARREPGRAAAQLAHAFREHPAALVDPTMLHVAIGSWRFQTRQRRLWEAGHNL